MNSQENGCFLFFYQGEQGMVNASEERNSLTKLLHFGEYHKENATKPQVSILTLPNLDIFVLH